MAEESREIAKELAQYEVSNNWDIVTQKDTVKVYTKVIGVMGLELVIETCNRHTKTFEIKTTDNDIENHIMVIIK